MTTATSAKVQDGNIEAIAGVLDILYHIPGLYAVLKEAEPLDMVGTEIERHAFADLKVVFSEIASGKDTDNINFGPLVEKLANMTSISLEAAYIDVCHVWDSLVKLCIVVIPPLREVFLGHVANSRERLEIPGRLNLMSRCFRAKFTEKSQTLEQVCQECYTVVSEKHVHDAHDSAQMTTLTSNAMVLRRAPEIFVVSVESSHYVGNSGKKGEGGSATTDACMSAETSTASSSSSSSSSFSGAVKFPMELDLNAYAGKKNKSAQYNSRMYDLVATVAVEGAKFSAMRAHFLATKDDGSGDLQWHATHGAISGQVSSPVESSQSLAVENIYYMPGTQTGTHPRLLVYTKRNLPTELIKVKPLVTRAGQLKALGDVAFALTNTLENYEEARQYYEEAIQSDESYRASLKENLDKLETLERTQKARKFEEQADLALANRRFKEASEHYTSSLRSALHRSRIYHRVLENLIVLTTCSSWINLHLLRKREKML